MRIRFTSFYRKPVRLVAFAGAVVFAASPAFGAITLVNDPDYPSNAAMFTLDPEQHSPASRGVTADRQLRQTFQLDSSVLVNELVLSLRLDGANGGLVVNFFEVDDVLASSWTPGDMVHSFTLDTTVDLPDVNERVGFMFSDDDTFLLEQRNTGSQGYGIELSNLDGSTNIGSIRHSNSGDDIYSSGVFYIEDGSISASHRDFGVAIVPEPSTYALVFGSFGLLLGILRWRRKR